MELKAVIATEEIADDKNVRVEWKLLTDLLVTVLAEATKKLGWYSQRWKVEVFQNIMNHSVRLNAPGWVQYSV